MKELIDALTRTANAVAAYYENLGADKQDGAIVPEKPLPEDVPAKPKRSSKKVEAPANPNYDVLDEAGGKGTVTADIIASRKEITEADSAKAVTDTAKLLVSKYAKPVSPDNKPEGFHIAKALLLEDFKVGRLSDLSHEQRVEFVAVVRGILTDDRKAQAILNRKAAAV